MKELIEVEHAGIEGTAWMPATALKTMTGWKPVAKKTAAKKAVAKKTADSASEAPKEES